MHHNEFAHKNTHFAGDISYEIELSRKAESSFPPKFLKQIEARLPQERESSLEYEMNLASSAIGPMDASFQALLSSWISLKNAYNLWIEEAQKIGFLFASVGTSIPNAFQELKVADDKIMTASNFIELYRQNSEQNIIPLQALQVNIQSLSRAQITSQLSNAIAYKLPIERSTLMNHLSFKNKGSVNEFHIFGDFLITYDNARWIAIIVFLVAFLIATIFTFISSSTTITSLHKSSSVLMGIFSLIFGILWAIQLFYSGWSGSICQSVLKFPANEFSSELNSAMRMELQQISQDFQRTYSDVQEESNELLYELDSQSSMVQSLDELAASNSLIEMSRLFEKLISSVWLLRNSFGPRLMEAQRSTSFSSQNLFQKTLFLTQNLQNYNSEAQTFASQISQQSRGVFEQTQALKQTISNIQSGIQKRLEIVNREINRASFVEDQIRFPQNIHHLQDHLCAASQNMDFLLLSFGFLQFFCGILSLLCWMRHS